MTETTKRFLNGQIATASDGVSFDVLTPPDPKLGDYSTNLAFVLAKREGKRPVDVANALKLELETDEMNAIAEIKVAPNGFLNFFLKPEFLEKQFSSVEAVNIGGQKKVIVEYSSPNIAKPMHIGHLRSTIIGDALANVYEKLGYDVTRWNFIGDWGTQYGKVIVQIKKELEDSGKPLSEIYVSDINTSAKAYVKFHEDTKLNPGLEDKAREEFKKLEEGDSENKVIWERDKKESLRELSRIFKELGVPDSDMVRKGESDYEPRLKPLIAELEQKGVAKESEGALIIELDNLAPALLRKSDGATLYMTRDLASLEDRIQNYQPAKILYVVANQQALHFEQLFAVAKKLGWNSAELEHVKFGMVLGEDGKKLATREGKVVLLEDVLREAEAKALKVVKEKNPDAKNPEEIARVIALGGLKYNDLKQHPHTDIKFDWDSMLDFAGNSGPYLQYTYARFANILSKAGTGDRPTSLPLGLDPEGKLIEHHVNKYWDILIECTQVNALTGLALYLYELAALLNRFYESVRVLDEKDTDKKNARLRLIKIASDNLADGLKLLGIQTLERI